MHITDYEHGFKCLKVTNIPFNYFILKTRKYIHMNNKCEANYKSCGFMLQMLVNM